jgi:hypothetical protein
MQSRCGSHSNNRQVVSKNLVETPRFNSTGIFLVLMPVFVPAEHDYSAQDDGDNLRATKLQPS